MKLSKILLGAVAGAAVLGLMSCGPIAGAGKKYSINKTNESTTEIARFYEDTAMKHAGGLVKVTFKADCIDNETKVYGTGQMGTIFGLEEKSGKSTFYILSVTDKGYYYVSKFENVTDFNAFNFGYSDKADSTIASAGTNEITIVTFPASGVTFDTDDNGNKYVYLYERALIDGTYDWAILKLTDDQLASFDIDSYTTSGSYKNYATVLKSGNIGTSVTGYEPVDSESKLTQKKLAVYANIYPTNTLVGEWYYTSMYKEAEVIE